MAFSESYLQMWLARDPAFLHRLQYSMAQQARVVKSEPTSTPNHAARSNYATTVINNPAGMAAQAATVIVGGVNLIGTIEATDNGPVTSATDPAILSQVATFWDALAGVDTGTAA